MSELQATIELVDEIELEVEITSENPIIVARIYDGIDGGTASTTYPIPDDDPLLIQLQWRRDNLSEWIDQNPILRNGEAGYLIDEQRFVLGNGSDDFNTLITDENNLYVPKAYIDYWISVVFGTYDGIIGTLVMELITLQGTVSGIEANLLAEILLRETQVLDLQEQIDKIPVFIWGETPLPKVGDLTGTIFTTAEEYTTGTIQCYRGGPNGKVMVSLVENAAQEFTLPYALEGDEELIINYIKKI